MKELIKTYFQSLFFLWALKLSSDTKEGIARTLSFISDNEKLIKENLELKERIASLESKNYIVVDNNELEIDRDFYCTDALYQRALDSSLKGLPVKMRKKI